MNIGERVETEEDSFKLNEVLEGIDLSLNDFQIQVQQAIVQKSNVPFRTLLRRCFLMELTEQQTIRILMECRRFEVHHVKPSLLSYPNGETLRRQQMKQANKDLPLQTARVAVFYGLIYSRGVGLPRNSVLAQRYFEFGVEMNFMDAFLMAGLMTKRRDYSAKATDPLLVSIAKGTQDEATVSLIEDLKSRCQSTEEDTNAVEESANPTAMYYLALKLAREIKSMKYDTDEESRARLQKIHHASELFLRSYLTLLRTGYQENAKRVDDEFAKFYHAQVTLFKKDEVSQESLPLQQGAKTVQYYYGILYPNLYETLVLTSDDNEIVLDCILSDGVCSSRDKMRRVIKLLGSHLPLDLFAGRYQSLENLGHIAYQAVGDCLALYSHVSMEYREEIAAELKVFSTFANEVLWTLERRDFTVYDESTDGDTLNEMLKERDHREHFATEVPRPVNDPFFSRLNQRTKALLKQRYESMVRLGDAGFSTALRLMIGVSPGSKKLVLPRNNHAAFRLYGLIKDAQIDFLFKPETASVQRIELLIAIVSGLHAAVRDNEFLRVQEELKELRDTLDIEQDRVRLLAGKPSDTTTGGAIDIPVLRKAALQNLQDLADFYGLIEEATMPELASGKEPTKPVLFALFKENRRFLDEIEEAIKLFESPEYRPSRLNIFSATFGKSAEYQEQLKAAKKLLKDCELHIFDRFALLKVIDQFLSNCIDKQKPWSFALVLMKVMSSKTSPLIPKKCFDLDAVTQKYKNEPAMTFRQFCSSFAEYFLRTDLISVSEFDFKF